MAIAGPTNWHWPDVCGKFSHQNQLTIVDIPGIKHRIIKHLPAYLLRHGSVDIHGLGRFRLHSKGSRIDYAASKVFPPFYDISFEPGQYGYAREYVSYLSKRLGLDDALISDVMSGYTASLQQSIEQQETIMLEGLGSIGRDHEHRWYFKSDQNYWGEAAVADLAIAFEPVPRLKEMA